VPSRKGCQIAAAGGRFVQSIDGSGEAHRAHVRCVHCVHRVDGERHQGTHQPFVYQD
jgi:hypothetical protein